MGHGQRPEVTLREVSISPRQVTIGGEVEVSFELLTRAVKILWHYFLRFEQPLAFMPIRGRRSRSMGQKLANLG